MLPSIFFSQTEERYQLAMFIELLHTSEGRLHMHPTNSSSDTRNTSSRGHAPGRCPGSCSSPRRSRWSSHRWRRRRRASLAFQKCEESRQRDLSQGFPIFFSRSIYLNTLIPPPSPRNLIFVHITASETAYFPALYGQKLLGVPLVVPRTIDWEPLVHLYSSASAYNK